MLYRNQTFHILEINKVIIPTGKGPYKKRLEVFMLGKMMCVLRSDVLGYIVREDISEVAENVIENLSGQSPSDSGNECPAEGKAASSDGLPRSKKSLKIVPL